MSLPANIRVNVRAPFPSLVKTTGFLTVSKSGGVWTVAADYRNLTPNTALTTTQVVALQDTATGVWTYQSLAAAFSGIMNVNRTITTTGSVSVLTSDIVLLFKKVSSGASTVLLPPASVRGGAPVILKDLTGDAATNTITAVPDGIETIDGFSGADAAANGVAVVGANYGARTFYPMKAGGGWFTL